MSTPKAKATPKATESKKEEIPGKRIFDAEDVKTFQRSAALAKLRSIFRVFITRVHGVDVPPDFLKSSTLTKTKSEPDHAAVREKKMLLEWGVSPVVIDILSTLSHLDQTVDEIPIRFDTERYGRTEFRVWHSAVDKFINEENLLRDFDEDVRNELQYYLLHSFGSPERLDYGTGHELNFIAYLGAVLESRNYLDEISGREVLMIFATYYDLARRLISDYRLEPAGSHGVWGLDDHFHFIYILGAAQFNPPVKPDGYRYIPHVRQVLEAQTLDLCKFSNLYVNSIAFILRMKLGPFNEHSPIIFDIHRTVSFWSKVLSGLQKMYDAEVLKKTPVVQHFYFGNKLYLWQDAETKKLLPSSKWPHAPTPKPKNDKPQEELPGLINGLKGTKTTLKNVSLTKAPWSSKSSSRDSLSLSLLDDSPLSHLIKSNLTSKLEKKNENQGNSGGEK